MYLANIASCVSGSGSDSFLHPENANKDTNNTKHDIIFFKYLLYFIIVHL